MAEEEKPSPDDRDAEAHPRGADPDAPPDVPPQGSGKKKDERPFLKRTWVRIAIVVIVVLLLGVFLWWFFVARNWVKTDDAFLDGRLTRLSSQISGRVLRVLVNDNQQVRAGDVLVEIDDRDMRARFAQAEADLASASAQQAQAKAQFEVQKAKVEQSRAQLRVAEAEFGNADRDLRRFETTDRRAVSMQQLDQARATQLTAKARLEAAKRALAAEEAQLAASAAAASAAEAAVARANAALEAARLQLSYARVEAPVDGVVTNRTVEAGAYAQPGEALLGIVQRELWVVANFKESQLERMRPGQEVRVTVDAYPDLDLHGHVDSVMRGTGARFSALPAENATGNYVKVVQRVPVKIVLDDLPADLPPLGLGLSVVPKVRVR